MRRGLIGAAFGVVASLACGGGGGGGGGGNPPATTTGTVLFTNNAAMSVNYLYVSPSGSTTWGSPQNSAPIAAGGGALTLSGVPPNTYDAKAVAVGVYSTYRAFAYQWGLGAGQTYYLTAYNSNFSGSLKVSDGNSTYSLTGVYVSPTSSSTWGVNQIPTPIPSGGSYDIQTIPAGTYDLKCVFSSGASSTGTYAISSLSQTAVTCY